MIFLIGLLTLAMVLDCVALIGLVLIQLPKKDTGGGLAFGGGASDALFGAGSGNVLTKVTKYAAVIFFILAVSLSVLQRMYHGRSSAAFGSKLDQPATAPAALAQPPITAPAPALPTSPAPLISTNQLLPLPPIESTNLPSAATNSAATNSAVSPPR